MPACWKVTDGLCPVFAAKSGSPGCNNVGGANGAIGDVGCEQSDGYVLYVQWGIGVQPRHQRVGHGRSDDYVEDVRWGIGVQSDASVGTRGKVTSMTRMFHGASAFNQDIGDWDT